MSLSQQCKTIVGFPALEGSNNQFETAKHGPMMLKDGATFVIDYFTSHGGVAVHVNYNGLLQKRSLSIIPFVRIRN